MAASLAALSPDLLGIIADFCLEFEREDRSLLDLRSTCRWVEAGLRSKWIDAYFSCRVLDLDAAKLAEATAVGTIPEFARATTVLEVQCRDESKIKQFNSEHDNTQPSAEILDLSFRLLAALQYYKNIKTIEFIPTRDGINETRSDSDGLVIGYSATFSFIILAVQACGLRPESIFTVHPKDEEFPCVFELTSSEFMPQLRDCFSALKLFRCRLAVHDTERGVSDFAHDFALGLNLMQSLTSLTLDFHASTDDGLAAIFFKELNFTVRLPQLAGLHLRGLSCSVQDLISFIIKHAATLERCTLALITATEDVAMLLYRTLLGDIQSKCKLSYLSVRWLKLCWRIKPLSTFPR